jgi:hypothetical protein
LLCAAAPNEVSASAKHANSFFDAEGDVMASCSENFLWDERVRIQPTLPKSTAA